MSQWDEAASGRLEDIVEQLCTAHVIATLEKTVEFVWSANVTRYEPSELGDTSRSLGVTAAENVRELTLRESWSAGSSGLLGQDVHVTAPNDSLLVQVGGVSLRVMKAPARLTLAEPNWSDFVWNNESDVRKAAARNNRARYNPFQIGSGTLFDGVLPVEGDPSALCDALLVWAGGSSSPETGGWIGLPTLSADSPWLAVQQVWWHQASAKSAERGPTQNPDGDADTFESREFPRPAVRLKPKSKPAEQ